MLASWFVAARSYRYSQKAKFCRFFPTIYFDKKHVFLNVFLCTLSKEIVCWEGSQFALISLPPTSWLPLFSIYFLWAPSYFLCAWDSRGLLGSLSISTLRDIVIETESCTKMLRVPNWSMRVANILRKN